MHEPTLRTRARLATLALGAALLASACAARIPPAPSDGAPEAAGASSSPASVEDAVVAEIPIQGFGTAIALSPDGSRAYVTISGAVVVLDTTANRVVSSIATGDTPHAIAISPDGKLGYAVDLTQHEMWVLDLVGARVARTVTLGARRTPALRPGIALSADGSTAYVTISQPEGQGFDTLQIVDLASGTVKQRGLDFHPGALAADRSGLLWITGCTGLCADGTLHLIDPKGIGAIAKKPLPSVPGGLALTPGGKRLFVANGLAGSVSVFDVPTRSLVATVRVGAEPLGVAAAPGGRLAYVTSFAAGTLAAIDVATTAVVATAKVGNGPRAIAVSPDGRRGYLTHSTSIVSVVDLSRLAS